MPVIEGANFAYVRIAKNTHVAVKRGALHYRPSNREAPREAHAPGQAGEVKEVVHLNFIPNLANSDKKKVMITPIGPVIAKKAAKAIESDMFCL